MKNVLYLIVVFGLLFTACEKEDPIVPEGISVEDFIGKWNFESLDFADVKHNTPVDGVFDTKLELSALNVNYDFIQLDFYFISSMELNLYSDYAYEHDNDADWDYFSQFNEYLPYSYADSIFTVDGNYLKFEIISFNVSQLQLKMIDGNKDMPIGGIYTLKKQQWIPQIK